MDSIGQTAPRLIAILRQADRRNQHGRNPYIDKPRGYDEQSDRGQLDQSYQYLRACKHQWTTQEAQSHLPEGTNLEAGRVYNVRCFCQLCHWHVGIAISHKGDSCPKTAFPLHHFVDFKKDKDHPEQEWYEARCSGCTASLQIHYAGRRLLDSEIALLTDVSHLKKRCEAARRIDCDRDFTVAKPLQVLDALSCYVRDALGPMDKHRPIPRQNRRFIVSFGDDCEPFLEKLGFKMTDQHWILPETPEESSYDRMVLEDIQEELWAFMRVQLQATNTAAATLKGYSEKPEPFDSDIQLLLGTVEYDKTKATRRATFLTQDEEMWYNGLGALPDFSDELLRFAFDRQVAYDPQGSPFYFDSFKELANKRNSEEMEIATALLASDGYIGREEIAKAYHYFTLDHRNAALLSDSHIRGIFETRLSCSAPWQESEIRQHLQVIGKARGSRDLQDAAANDMRTAEQAIKWLEPSYNGSEFISDERIVVLIAVKKGEAPENKQLQDQIELAIQLIANTRNSEYLRMYAATGEAPAMADDDEIGSAFAFFNLTDRNAVLDQDQIQNLKFVWEDDPSKAEKTERYIGVLSRYFDPSVQAANYKNPVGLHNIGNTCYLNCLLQYFYAIKPFRDLIGKYDSHKEDISGNATLGKINGVPVRRADVRKAQQFIPELQSLFLRMATATESSVRPTTELAAQALAESESTPDSPTLERKQLPSPAPGAVSGPERFLRHGDQYPPTPESEGDDASSDVTLIGDTILTPDSETDENQKDVVPSIEPGEIVPSIEPADAIKPDALPAGGRRDSLDMEDGQPLNPAPPDRPPPVPPRPNANQGKNEIFKGAQQDVHEVIGNVLFKVQCAIKPDGLDEEGNRQNRITELFDYDCVHEYPDKSLENKKENGNTFIFSILQKPRNIHAALDSLFDVESVNLGGRSVERHMVARHLPPVLQFFFQKQDMDSKGEAIISKHHVELEDTICMDRYLQTDNPGLEDLREQSRELSRRLTEERAREEVYTTKLGPASESLDAIREFLSVIEDDVSDTGVLQDALKQEAQTTAEELEDARIKINELETKRAAIPFEKFDTPGNKYRLFAVFVHMGRDQSGHYWIFLRDFENDVWRKYEDMTVTEVKDTKEIFEARDPQSQGAPYFVVYVKDNRKNLLVDAVHRIKPEPPAEASYDGADADGDVRMGDLPVSTDAAPPDSPLSDLSDPSSMSSLDIDSDFELPPRSPLPRSPPATYTRHSPVIDPLVGHHLARVSVRELIGGVGDDSDGAELPMVTKAKTRRSFS